MNDWIFVRHTINENNWMYTARIESDFFVAGDEQKHLMIKQFTEAINKKCGLEKTIEILDLIDNLDQQANDYILESG